MSEQLANEPNYQDRVRLEKDDLDSKILRLNDFLVTNPIYETLPADEQSRLRRQLDVMREYSSILGERIGAF